MKRIRPLFLLTIAFASSSIGSCKPAVIEVCDEKLPQFSHEVERALSLLNPRIAPELIQGGARRLASASSVSVLSAEEKNEWTQWAEKLLVQSQNDLDAVENDSSLLPLKSEFSKVAMLWVVFHGHAQRGNLKKMVETLNRIQEHAVRGRRVCSKS